MSAPQTALVVLGTDDARALIRDEVQRATEPLSRDLAELKAARKGGPEAMLTAVEVAALLRVNVRELRRLVREERFPAPVKVGARAIRWPAAVVARATNGGAP